MLISKWKYQPVAMGTTTSWDSFSDNNPNWFWLVNCSTYQATCPLVLYPPNVWMPEITHLTQWEFSNGQFVPFLSPFYGSSCLYSQRPVHKLSKDWFTSEGMHVHLRSDLAFSLTKWNMRKESRHTPRTRVFSSYYQHSGGIVPTQKHEDRLERQMWLKPTITHCTRPSLPIQMKEFPCSLSSSWFSSKLSMLTKFRHKKSQTGRKSLSYRRTLMLAAAEQASNNRQKCVDVSVHRSTDEVKEKSGEGMKDNRPIASTPVPGSPWCVVWTGDDRMFFFNPTIHVSVWEKPGELTGCDISHIVKNPPHKRKKTTPAGIDSDSTYQNPALNGISDNDNHEHTLKKFRKDESLSLVPNQDKSLPLELRITHFRAMMLERGVSAFSRWEKELHKMVFDPRYLLLSVDQRKQVFGQFVKSRVKEEYKEKRSKKQKVREEFKQLLQKEKITNRTTFKEFCVHYQFDQRFNALSRKKEKEALFNDHIKSLKKRNKVNRARLRKIRSVD
ncbi:transcription elongation regulator 1 [Cyprinodon tularosa]|uniref:transcription elongation regulator 1 n=1 Tax=Cyprinodon tularosa TaxID=77115 RepID=UPI0018E1F5C1|nr:transcription elongation regulator 1 [Cyprinodon tularosa]